MNKKTIILLALISIALLAAIGAAIFILYSGAENETATKTNAPTPSHSALLKAVPSDAAALACFSDVRKGVLFLTDPAGMFSPLFAKTRSANFNTFLSRVSEEGFHGAPMVISLHFSGNLEPLMIVDAGRAGADTTALVGKLLKVADRCSLSYELVSADRQMLLISASDALVGSSRRHVDSKTSIMDNRSFISSLATVQGTNVIFFCHDYAPQLVSTYMDRHFRKYSDFIKRFSDWTAFSIDTASDHHLAMSGSSTSGKSPSYYHNLLSGVQGGTSRLADVLPEDTQYAVTLACVGNKKFRPLFEKYLDASGKLSSYKATIASLEKGESGPLEWQKNNEIKEIALVGWKSGKDTFCAIFVRTSEKYKGEIHIDDNIYSGYPAALFGDIFSLKDESSMVRADVWTVIGSWSALYDWISCGRANMKIPSDSFSACVILPPSVIVWEGDEVRVEAYSEDAPSSELRDETSARPIVSGDMQVSKGPFPVKNCATGKTNQFYQNEHLSLCLNDENGKGLWGVSFDKPICGCVGMIDNYANGKIQFVFCAGSKLYVIDRLGRFVSGFPVQLDSDVVLGPGVYDFSGNKKYNVLVLHKGNRVDMYNLKGEKPEGWKGIITHNKMLSLPELVVVDGKNYWKVTTSAGIQAYDFLGGEPLKGKMEKMIIK